VTRESGFTLIEVLVAVIVTSLLLLSVYGVFTTVAGARQRVEGAAEHFHEARVIFDRLGREVHGVYLTSSNLQSSFRGGLNEEGRPYLELSTTTATPQSGGGGIVIVRYDLQADPDHGGQLLLLRSERPFFTKEFRPTDTLTMASGIASLQLRYFADGSWHDEWDSATAGLPQLLEVTLNEADPAGVVPFVTSFTVKSTGGGS
jgi:general secretion pathway protein J